MFDGAPTFYVGADIFMDLEYFMSADISWMPTFQGADISGRRHFRAPTFHGRRHFMGADILTGSEHFMCKLLF
jgi:hypothetical protein